MYAVIQAGGHQYRVSKGEALVIDRVPGEAGAKITFDRVLLIGDTDGAKSGSLKIGKPYVQGAKVEAEIKEQTRNEKIVIFKYHRRKNYKVTQGHRQPVTVVEIKGITH